MNHGALMSVALLTTTSALASPAARREERPDFKIDEDFQRRGGVQVFIELANAETLPATNSRFQMFQVIDRRDRLKAIAEPVHVAMVRVSYLIEKDVSFFSEQRLRDLSYVRAIAPDMDVRARTDGSFTVSRIPSNRFTLTYRDSAREVPEIAALAGSTGAPVVEQENSDFGRVMGWRTGAWSSTWTFHEPVARGQTRVTVLTLSYLYNVPPDFMGGERRVVRETMEQTLAMIDRLRRYEP